MPEAGSVVLAPNLIAHRIKGGRIAENIVQFVRLLRAAGLDVGPQRVILASEAAMAVGIERPQVLKAALSAALVSRPQDRAIFDQAFYLFWKDPGYLDQLLSVMLPSLRRDSEPPGAEMSRRLRDSLMPHGPEPRRAEGEGTEFEISEGYSASAVSRTKDFEQMSAEEQRRAREALRAMSLIFAPLKTRRQVAAPRGETIDLRRMCREAGARGSDHLVLRRKARAWRVPPVVLLCDISGSMDAYARLFLHFLYSASNARDRVNCFLFGTRLHNVTRLLKGRDPDQAMARVSTAVDDFAGGTRIGESIEAFNRLWARRVLGGRATVILFTDGLDRDAGEGVERAMRRLRASCRRLIWLNPLLRYSAYQPIAAGARAIAPHVSEMRPCHNLESLEGLARAIAGRGWAAGRPRADQPARA
ncbi:MAG: VWA domain-containing protein [Rhizobiales bacterium]|nr:VWA domain-containing protein [Hyphomicrobiales bacterium]